MKKIRILLISLLLIIACATISEAQEDITIPGFGKIPFVNTGDLYTMDFGKLGKFNFSGSVDPLELTTTVGMEDLKAFPGAKVMSFLGLQDIEMSVRQKGLGIAANFDDHFKDDLVDELNKIEIKGFPDVIGTIINTLEIRESQAVLNIGTNGSFTGELDFNIFVFGKKIPIPKIKGTLKPQEILKVITGTIKDEGLDILGDLGKVVAEAAVKSAKVVANSAEDAFKYGKVVAQHSTHSKSQCDNKCVPKLAKKMAKPMRLGSQRAIGEFYADIIPVLKNVQGKTDEETINLRKQKIEKDWNALIADIDNQWQKIRSNRSYVKIYINPSSATNGGKIYRNNIDKEKNKYVAYRTLIWNRLLNDKGLEWKNNQIYMIQSKQYGTYWDLKGNHLEAEKLGGNIIISAKDNIFNGKQGADRLISVIPIEVKGKTLVSLQPQHSTFIAGVKSKQSNSGTAIELTSVSAQVRFFEKKAVNGEANTFYLINPENDLYITANQNGPITQEIYSNSDNQKWVFEWADDPFIMAAPDVNFRYAIKNESTKKSMNILKDRIKNPKEHKPFKASKRAGRKSVRVTVADKKHGEGSPDQYFRFYPISSGKEQYFNLKPMLGQNVLNVMDGNIKDGSPIELWKKNDEIKEQFKFIYAGSAMTYFIQERNSGKFLETPKNNYNEGAPVQIHSFTGEKNQKWVLEAHYQWVIPAENQKFYIKSVYCNNEYWDATNKSCSQGTKIKNNAKSSNRERLFTINRVDGQILNIQSMAGGTFVDIPEGSTKKGVQLVLNNKNSSESQKFKFEFTSPTTFRILSNLGMFIDVSGDSEEGDGWKDNHQKIQTNVDYYVRDRHWQLIYADGPNSGRPYVFEQNTPIEPQKSKPGKQSSKSGKQSSKSGKQSTKTQVKKNPTQGHSTIKYDKSTGSGAIYRDGKLIRKHSGWKKSWHTILRIGCFNDVDGDVEKFLFYSKRAGVIKIYKVAKSGYMLRLNTINNIKKDWASVTWIPDGSCNGKIKFQKANGFWKIYTCDNSGNLKFHSSK